MFNCDYPLTVEQLACCFEEAWAGLLVTEDEAISRNLSERQLSETAFQLLRHHSWPPGQFIATLLWPGMQLAIVDYIANVSPLKSDCRVEAFCEAAGLTWIGCPIGPPARDADAAWEAVVENHSLGRQLSLNDGASLNSHPLFRPRFQALWSNI